MIDALPDDLEEGLAKIGGLTLSLGHNRLSLIPTGVEGEAYVLFCFTPPEYRQQGSWSRLRACLRYLADEESWTLVSHPENDWIRVSMERTGWNVIEGPTLHGQPRMHRLPQPLGERPQDMDDVQLDRYTA